MKLYPDKINFESGTRACLDSVHNFKLTYKTALKPLQNAQNLLKNAWKSSPTDRLANLWGSADPAGGANGAPPDPLAGTPGLSQPPKPRML